MKNVQGIVTLFDVAQDELVKTLWRLLEVECGSAGVKIAPVPHFSWQIVESYNMERVEPILQDIVNESNPFIVRTAGLGLFTGEKPIVYIPLVKDARLLRFHKRIWEQTRLASTGVSELYSPGLWMPHITLVHEGVDRTNLGCLIEKLAFQTFDWEILVDNIALVEQSSVERGETRLHLKFGGLGISRGETVGTDK